MPLGLRISLLAGVALLFFAWPATLQSQMTGGNFNIFGDSFSAIEGDFGTGGAFALSGSAESVAVGRLGQSSSSGTIRVTDAFPDYDEIIVLNDGVVRVQFHVTNLGGSFNATCVTGAPPCDSIYLDLGGGADFDEILGAQRLGEAVTSTNHGLNMSVTLDGVGNVILKNLATPGSAGNIPITTVSDDNTKFVVLGMAEGSDAGFELRGGFQAMERGTITLSVSASSLSFGQLATGVVSTADLTLTATTDSATGYSVTMQEDGNLRSGANDIDDVADGSVTAGAEEYGVITTGGDGQLATDTAITSSATTVASRSSQASGVQTPFQFRASIAATQTREGNYSHIVTFSGTANP